MKKKAEHAMSKNSLNYVGQVARFKLAVGETLILTTGKVLVM